MNLCLEVDFCKLLPSELMFPGIGEVVGEEEEEEDHIVEDIEEEEEDSLHIRMF